MTQLQSHHNGSGYHCYLELLLLPLSPNGCGTNNSGNNDENGVSSNTF